MHPIPFDVLVSIFYYLDPLDIINFSKTCTTVHEAESARSVWITAYQNACFRNGIFTATYTIGDLSTLELKHIATSPSRILKILQRGQDSEHQQSSLCPFFKYSFNPLVVLPIARRRKPHSLYLVPGGRLLVAVSESYISVFDLEHVQKHGIVQEDTDTNSKVFHRGLLLSISPTIHDDKVQIVASKQLTYGPNGTGSAVISVWEYAPESQSLNEVASTTLQNTKHLDIIMSCLAGNLLIYFNTRLNTVNVWDFKEDLHAIFAAPENTSRGLSDIMYNRGRIILLGYECAAVWDMPELQSARPDIASMEPIAPDFQVIFGLPEELIPSRAISLQGMDTHRWDQYVDHGLPLLLDTISDKTGSLQIMLNDAYNYPVPNATSFYSHTFRDSSESVLKRWRVKQRYCKDTIVRTWYSLLSGTFYLSLLPSPGSDGAASQPLDTPPILVTTPVRSLRPWCKSWQDYSFDPASGRLCAVGQNGEITVVDYLVNPTKATGASVSQWEDCKDWDAKITGSDSDDSDN